MLQLWNKTSLFLIVFWPYLAGCHSKKNDATSLRETTVTQGDITQAVTVTGVLTPKRRLVVYPTFDGSGNLKLR